MQINLLDAIQGFEPAAAHGINAPYAKFKTIDLTGDGGTVFIDIALQPQEAWPYGIFHNAPFLILKADGGAVECIAKGPGMPTFRKAKAATPEAIAQKINNYIAKIGA